MKFNSGFEAEQTGIDMIPLIDVVFLLLVFFIYSMLSMTVHRAIGVRLPQADKSEVVTENYITISISENNELFLEDKPVVLEEVIPRLGIKNWVENQTPVSIHGDSRSQLGTAVTVLDYLSRHGFEQVSISVERTGENSEF